MNFSISKTGVAVLIIHLFTSIVVAGSRPNVLLIVADDQSPEDLHIYNSESSLETPNIDRIAREGMVFEGAYHMGAWAGAVCAPSRHMIMTGRTVWHIPGSGNPNATKKELVPPDLADFTLPAVFNRAGYETMRTCKQGNSYDAANKKFQIVHDATHCEAAGSDWHADRVLDYLTDRQSRHASAPFLIYLGFSHPHDTRDGKPELLAKYGATNHRDRASLPPANSKQPRLPINYLPAHPFDNGASTIRDEVAVEGVWDRRDERTIRNEIGRQYACSENIDIQIGRVLKKLKDIGELDNTFIVYTSDHGIAIGRHGLQGKQNLYEHTWRVPLIVKGPGAQANSRATGNVYLCDLLATLCDLAGIEPPATNEGLSFKPVLEGRQETIRDVLYGVYCNGGLPIMRCIKRGDWKLITYENTDGKQAQTQLFNLAENPNELLSEHHVKSVCELTGNVPDANQSDLAEDPRFDEKREKMEVDLLREARRLDDPYLQPAKPKVEFTHSTSAASKYKADWDSLAGYPVPEWFDDAKFGILIHWGPYSVMGYKQGGYGYAEHTPHRMYIDPQHYYPWMNIRFGGHPPEFGYKDVVPLFKAENWDPEQWADLFAKAGARYVVLTAEHHDGYAMWDSELTEWCATKIGPKRDLVGDLGKAVRARGMKYAPSYHRERHPSFFSDNGELDYSKVYSEPLPDIAREIGKNPKAEGLYGPFDYDDAFIADYVARWQEIQRKYHPDFMWLDDIPVFYRGPPDEQIVRFRQACAGMIADFLNDAEARNQTVYLNNKGVIPNWPVELGCREADNMRVEIVGPKWEDPATLGTSYGYMQAEELTDNYKSPTALIHLLCDVVSKNGNLLLNIGPRSDGTIPEGMQRRLLAMGKWLEVNGEAIYGTRPWKEHQETLRTKLEQQMPTGPPAIESNLIRFTCSADGEIVYCILPAWPDKTVTIKSFEGLNVAEVRLLGSDAKLVWRIEQGSLVFDMPELKPCEHAYVLAVTLGRG
jgi:alpha-L-fucosidase/arylsulfatase A-like enzyme